MTDNTQETQGRQQGEKDGPFRSETLPGTGSSGFDRNRFALFLGTTFFILNLLAVLNHAMWRDEWSVWLYARYSESIADLYTAVAGQGRPVGWLILAWAVCKLGFYPYGLKVVHVVLSTGFVYVVTRYSRFTRLQCVLLAFSYYVFYEYGTILRDYAPELFLLAVACTLFTSRPRRPVAFGVVLALLFQTTPFGIMIGCALGAVYLADLWQSRKDEPVPVGRLIGAAVIALASLAVAYVSAKTSLDSTVTLGATPRSDTLLHRIALVLPNIWRGLVPVPQQGVFGYTNFLDGSPQIQAALSVGIFLITALSLAPWPLAFLFFVLATGAMTAMFCAVPVNLIALRHHGHYLVIFIMGLWIAHFTPRHSLPTFLDNPVLAGIRRQLSPFVTLLLAVNCFAGIAAVRQELSIPFSGGREAAEIIRHEAPAGTPVIGDPDYAMATITGELDRPVFIASRGEESTYCKVDEKRVPFPLSPEELMPRVYAYSSALNSDVVLVVNYPLSLSPDAARLLGITKDCLGLRDEKFMVYLVKKK